MIEYFVRFWREFWCDHNGVTWVLEIKPGYKILFCERCGRNIGHRKDYNDLFIPPGYDYQGPEKGLVKITPKESL